MATAPTQPAQFATGCGPDMKSCQSSGNTAVTSPWASAYQHPANTATAAARWRDFTLKETEKSVRKRMKLLVLTFNCKESRRKGRKMNTREGFAE